MELLYLTLLTLIACLVGTVTGFGSSTIMVPILVLFFPLTEVLILATIIHLFVDFWKIILFFTKPPWKLILSLGITGALFGWIFSMFAINAAPWHIRVLGLLLIFSVLFSSLERFSIIKPTTFSALVGGSISGMMAGVFGIGGPIRTLILNSFKLPKAAYLFASGTIGLMVDAGRMIGYLTNGLEMRQYFWLGLILLIPASLLGSLFGKRIVRHVSTHQFRLIVSGFLMLVGLRLILIPTIPH